MKNVCPKSHGDEAALEGQEQCSLLPPPPSPCTSATADVTQHKGIQEVDPAKKQLSKEGASQVYSLPRSLRSHSTDTTQEGGKRTITA